MTSWAVDLADVGAVYPFQGTEFILYIAGLVFWIWWHVAQIRAESREVRYEIGADTTGEATRRAIAAY
ncbi:hypothetical protein FP2506_16739 [Fulvimarina pelagi HTCC2506]|uniref:Uncharacterized protein n=2 Tax=Fulvimarina pelagi TaxID=217511 RepID=Q0G2T2_9HYPH|nr:hypothetical protein FP2506_16739 [Fulvimarina pelagi HTCC2506]